MRSTGVHDKFRRSEPTILIVDDNEFIRSTLSKILRADGYEVFTASNGQDALVKLSAIKPLPSAILLDLNMPRMDGKEFRSAQIQNGDLAGIPVILFSSSIDIEMEAALLNVSAFIEKDLNPTLILETIRRVLKP